MSKIKSVSNFILGLVTIALSTALYFYSDRYADVINIGLGPSFTPKLVAVLALLCGLSILFRSFFEEQTKKNSKNNNLLKAVIIMAVTFLYVYLLNEINYLAITAIYLFALMILLIPQEIDGLEPGQTRAYRLIERNDIQRGFRKNIHHSSIVNTIRSVG